MRMKYSLLILTLLLLSSVHSSIQGQDSQLNTDSKTYNLGDEVSVYGLTVYGNVSNLISINVSKVYFMSLGGERVDKLEPSMPVSLAVPVVNVGDSNLKVTAVMTIYRENVPVYRTFTFTNIPPRTSVDLGLGWRSPEEPDLTPYRLEVVFLEDLESLRPLINGKLWVEFLEDGSYVIGLEVSKTGIVTLKLLNPGGKFVLASGINVRPDGSFEGVIFGFPETC